MAPRGNLLAPTPNRIVTLKPNRGLYRDRSPVFVPEGGMLAVENYRIRDGVVTNERMGNTRMVDLDELVLPDPITHLFNFTTRSGISTLIICSRRDVAKYTVGSPLGGMETLLELYNAGTVTVPVGSSPSKTITGSGTLWDTGDNAKAGDYIFFTDNNRRDLAYDGGSGSKGWFKILQINSDISMDIQYENPGGTGWPGGTDYTIRKTLQMIDGDVWSSVTFPNAQPANEDTWYAVNGTEMMKWNGTAVEVTYLEEGVDLPFLARHLHVYKGQMLWGDLTEGAARNSVSIANSDVARPEVMDQGIASQFAAVTGTDPVIRMETLGDHVVVFGERSTNMIEFVGSPVGYTIRTALDKIGPFASQLVVNHGDYIEFVSDDRAYRFDGIGKTEFGSQVFRDLLRSSDGTRAWQSYAFRDTEEGEVHFVIAQTTDSVVDSTGLLWPSSSVVEHYVEQISAKDPTPFTLRSIFATAMTNFQRSGSSQWDEHPEQFNENTRRFDDRAFVDDAPILAFGTSSGQLKQLNVGETEDGADMISEVRFSRRATIDGEYKGVLRTLRPWIKTQGSVTQSVEIWLYAYDEPEGEDVKTAMKPFRLDKSGPDRMPFRLASRYHEIAIRFVSSGQICTFEGWEAVFIPLGKR